MATALQCPACGFKHRLDSVGDALVFPCSKCSRPLKLPAEFRPGASGTTAPRANGRTTSTAAGARTANASGARTRPAGRVEAGRVRLPLRILAWVIAFVLGAYIVSRLAKWTGFVGGDTFLDVMIDGSFGTYLRLFILVPIWALFATMLATLLIEAPAWWNRRQSGATTKATTETTTRAKATPRSRSGAPVVPAPATARRVAPRPPPESGDPQGRSGSDQRPRRIPRRDTGS